MITQKSNEEVKGSEIEVKSILSLKDDIKKLKLFKHCTEIKTFTNY